MGGLRSEAAVLREEALRHRGRLDELIAANAEHLAVLHQLEEAYDADVPLDPYGPVPGGPGGASPLTASDLPSGDELAAELERFLREQGG